jgi:hypothetical protein
VVVGPISEIFLLAILVKKPLDVFRVEFRGGGNLHPIDNGPHSGHGKSHMLFGVVTSRECFLVKREQFLDGTPLLLGKPFISRIDKTAAAEESRSAAAFDSWRAINFVPAMASASGGPVVEFEESINTASESEPSVCLLTRVERGRCRSPGAESEKSFAESSGMKLPEASLTETVTNRSGNPS